MTLTLFWILDLVKSFQTLTVLKVLLSLIFFLPAFLVLCPGLVLIKFGFCFLKIVNLNILSIHVLVLMSLIPIALLKVNAFAFYLPFLKSFWLYVGPYVSLNFKGSYCNQLRWPGVQFLKFLDCTLGRGDRNWKFIVFRAILLGFDTLPPPYQIQNIR